MMSRHNLALKSDVPISGPSLALGNLRAFVILLVLSFHSVLAYLQFLPSEPFRFDAFPYLWRAFPIVDYQRWFGFDLFCAWQDVFLMSLFFFLSGLFVWPSLARKGTLLFVYDRVLRLGLPFIVVVVVLMPLALYPTYLLTADDAGVTAYWRHWRALPFWPCGPMWFLWLLLIADVVAAGLYRLAPWLGGSMSRLSAAAAARPVKYLAFFLVLSALSYVPLALAFTSSAWFDHGPFAFQLSRPLHYALYFVAGIVIGAGSLDRGLLAPEGPLVRHWPVWLLAAPGLLFVWMGLTELTMTADGSYPLGPQTLADLSFVLTCFANCVSVLTLVLRFGAKRLPVFDRLKDSAYGIYLLHYLFVVWLQFALFGAVLPAVIKGSIVFCATLGLSWGSVAALQRVPSVAQIIGAARPRGVVVS